MRHGGVRVGCCCDRLLQEDYLLVHINACEALCPAKWAQKQHSLTAAQPPATRLAHQLACRHLQAQLQNAAAGIPVALAGAAAAACGTGGRLDAVPARPAAHVCGGPAPWLRSLGGSIPKQARHTGVAGARVGQRHVSNLEGPPVKWAAAVARTSCKPQRPAARSVSWARNCLGRGRSPLFFPAQSLLVPAGGLLSRLLGAPQPAFPPATMHSQAAAAAAAIAPAAGPAVRLRRPKPFAAATVAPCRSRSGERNR